MAAAATVKALSTIELLEQILLRLPMLEILTKQVVCRTWYECIRDSVSIQRRLFFTAISDSDAPKRSQVLHYTVQPVMVNPLISNIFRIRSNLDATRAWISVIGDASNEPREHMTPLKQHSTSEDLLERTPGRSLKYWRKRPIKFDTPDFYRLERRTSDPWSNDQYDISVNMATYDTAYTGVSRPYLYKSESWETMLLTQPPIPTVTLRGVGQGRPFGSIKVVAADGVGVRFGELLKTAGEFHRFWGQLPWMRGRVVELEMYQPIGDLRFPDDERSGRRAIHHCLKIGFVRAWKTRLRCVFDVDELGRFMASDGDTDIREDCCATPTTFSKTQCTLGQK